MHSELKNQVYYFTHIEPQSEIWVYGRTDTQSNLELIDIVDDRGFEPIELDLRKYKEMQIIYIKNVKFYTHER